MVSLGPGGLAAYLRGALLDAPYTSLSQPLDIGRSTRTVPAHLYKAVILRDQHCQFPGCTQPPSMCEVHHLIPWAKGGPTSLGNLRLFCRFHHQIAIHRWGWTITCHPDGTRTATGPDGSVFYTPTGHPPGRRRDPTPRGPRPALRPARRPGVRAGRLPLPRYPIPGLSRRCTGSGGPRLVGVVEGRRNSRPSGQRATYWAPLSAS